MTFGQEVVELLGASRFRAHPEQRITPSIVPAGIERIEIINGGAVKFGDNYYGKGAIFRHLEGDATVHISAPGKPYRCLSLNFRIKGKARRDFPRLTFWQNKNTLEDFIKNSVEGFHDSEAQLDVLGAYVYSTINWHSSRSMIEANAADVPKAIRQAISFLNQHTEAWIPVEYLAEMVGLSKPYFQALFKTHTGTTPHRYHLVRRIGLSCEKLAYGEQSISEISGECGFDNPESFYRAFKKITQMTPAQYRRRHSAQFWNS